MSKLNIPDSQRSPFDRPYNKPNVAADMQAMFEENLKAKLAMEKVRIDMEVAMKQSEREWMAIARERNAAATKREEENFQRRKEIITTEYEALAAIGEAM